MDSLTLLGWGKRSICPPSAVLQYYSHIITRVPVAAHKLTLSPGAITLRDSVYGAEKHAYQLCEKKFDV
jgi:hypothetical protein